MRSARGITRLFFEVARAKHAVVVSRSAIQFALGFAWERRVFRFFLRSAYATKCEKRNTLAPAVKRRRQ